MDIKLSPRFQKTFQKLEPRIQKQAVIRLRMFQESEGRNPILKTHKLHGKQQNEWSFSVQYSYRITFVFLPSGDMLCTDIGTHDELYT